MRQTFRARTPKLFSLVGLIFFVSVAGFSIFSNPVLAQTVYLPQFNLEQRVYIDPALAKHPRYPVQFHDIDRQLATYEQQHHIQIYLVAAQQRDHIVSNQTNQAAIELDNLLARWQNNAKFPRNTYLTIFWLRRSDNINRGWVAANAGSHLKAKGLTKDAFSNPDGLIIPTLKEYMPNDPHGAILAIVRNVNQVLATDQLEQQTALQLKYEQLKREQQLMADVLKQFQRYLPLGIIVLFVVGTLSSLCRNFMQRRTEARLVICFWQDRLNNANLMYTELYDHYSDFLKVRSNWAKEFLGETLTHYQAAANDFLELTIRLEAVNGRLQYALAARGDNFFPLTSGFHKAMTLLKSKPITVIGQDISLEMAGLFAGKTLEISEEPEQMLATMADLFAGTNQKLALIVRTFQTIKSIRSSVERLCLTITDIKGKLGECLIPFEPFYCRQEQLQQRWRSLDWGLKVDPLALVADAVEIEQAFEALAHGMERALTLNTELIATKKKIDATARKVKDVRASLIEYNYPQLECDPRALPSQLFALAEEGGNPDVRLIEAGFCWDSAHKGLLAGELDEAQSKIAIAQSALAQAEQIIEAVKAAKAFVEEQVGLTTPKINQLADALPSAQLALVSLCDEFLNHNFTESLEFFNQASLVKAIADFHLAQIKHSYRKSGLKASPF